MFPSISSFQFATKGTVGNFSPVTEMESGDAIIEALIVWPTGKFVRVSHYFEV